MIGTPTTIRFLNVLGYRVPEAKALPLDYGRWIEVDGEKLRLERAEHVMGAAQVFVETKDGSSIVYTGDFKTPGKGTPILSGDVLVIEATYGHPNMRRPFKEQVKQEFLDRVNDALALGPVRVFGYHGKLQEAMSMLRKAGVEAPFVVGGKVAEFTRVAMEEGLEPGTVLTEDVPDSFEVIKTGWYVRFSHFNEFRKRTNRHTNFLLSGWEFHTPVKKTDRNSYIVALSDHADFEDLVEYVSASRPNLVVTDGSRSKYAKDLANYIRRNLGIRAVPMPI
ncbi:hypothetical protein HS1genome_0894 [Sulfodiicoccus acidiphilus]|uniref:Zn-dependent metallo-hydrolase RNA specificity domain-containing protein n=1 Tax=Sulfodiicoccus acidiphilus TaxID=1670455 RepID=A0A348B2V3_9CREN|nr:hypothetical protein HS1genome_0894 [Sulfodiicoccus acidiphilus]GGT94059.1 hypothetical protein GCM10007116_09750 [Sulfodiicoccus acidiphilus]